MRKRDLMKTGVGLTLIAVGLLWVGAAAKGFGTTALSTVTRMGSTAPEVTPEEAIRAIATARDFSTAFRVVADQVLPSVVMVETTPKLDRTRQMSDNGQLPPAMQGNPFQGTPFEDMFRGAPMEQFRFDGPRMSPPRMSPQPKLGIGSGVIIDPSGLVLTNSHVVAGGENVNVNVRLHDGSEYEAEKIWTDPKTDIAVLKLQGAHDLPAARLGDSDYSTVGEWVLALGQPFGLESTVTAGIISAKGRATGINAREVYLQTDAAINPGNSGGPLVNLNGEVVGINTAISSRGGGNEGVGFAVPINLAKWVSNQLVSNGHVKRAYLGVGIQPVTAKLAQQFNVKPRVGVLVTQVYPDTPAAKAGLNSGDIITEYAGVRVSTPNELQIVVERSELGRPHRVSIVRDGRGLELEFTPEAQPDTFGAPSSIRSAPSKGGSSNLDELGMRLGDLTPSIAQKLGIEGVQGALIMEVRAGSLAEQAGLETGAVITQVNRKPVANAAECEQMLKDLTAGESALLLVQSDAGSRFVVL